MNEGSQGLSGRTQIISEYIRGFQKKSDDIRGYHVTAIGRPKLTSSDILLYPDISSNILVYGTYPDIL